MKSSISQVSIINKKARFEYEILSKYVAGIVLTGTEIKSIRLKKVSIVDSFCEFNDHGELFAINMYIEPYQYGIHFNHKPKSDRKLLLNKRELRSLLRKVKTKGNTIVPLKLFINDRGRAKLEIGLVKGKKLYDKRQIIKERENKVRLDRIKKQN